MRRRARRLLFVVAAAGIAAVASAVATPRALAHGCPPTGSAGTTFASWGDSTSYRPVRGGAFEPLQRDWSYSGGATVVPGNEPWYVGGANDADSLYLPSGSSAMSGDTCGPFLRPVVRFFVENVGSSTGLLHVEVIVNDGRDGVLDGGTISATSGWNVSPQITLPRPNIHPGAVAYAVRLTPVGDGAAFNVDDVYIDPYQSR